MFRGGALLEHYGYDGNGNRVLLQTPSGTIAGVYDAQDRLLSYGTLVFAYTADGELATKTDTATGATTAYTYDVRGNLVRVDLPSGDVIEYLIDGENRRVGKSKNGAPERRWIYRNGLDLVAELDGTGNLVSRFVYGSQPNAPEFLVRGGITYRILVDHLASPRAVVDIATGVVVWRADYDAWGNRVLISGSADFIPMGFAGGHFDHQTALVRFGARDYDAATGRWTAKDAGAWMTSHGNLYAYVDNDPIQFRDPTGFGPKCAKCKVDAYNKDMKCNSVCIKSFAYGSTARQICQTGCSALYYGFWLPLCDPICVAEDAVDACKKFKKKYFP